MITQILQFRTYLGTWAVARVRDERGASLVEYALLLALIAIICIGAINFIGGGARNSLSSTGTELNK